MFLSELQVFFIVNAIKKIWVIFADCVVLTPSQFSVDSKRFFVYNYQQHISKNKEKNYG